MFNLYLNNFYILLESFKTLVKLKLKLKFYILVRKRNLLNHLNDTLLININNS